MSCNRLFMIAVDSDEPCDGCSLLTLSNSLPHQSSTRPRTLFMRNPTSSQSFSLITEYRCKTSFISNSYSFNTQILLEGHSATLGDAESLYKLSLAEPCDVSDLAEILQSSFLLPHLLPIVAPERRQRQELGRGTEFSLSHHSFLYCRANI